MAGSREGGSHCLHNANNAVAGESTPLELQQLRSESAEVPTRRRVKMVKGHFTCDRLFYTVPAIRICNKPKSRRKLAEQLARVAVAGAADLLRSKYRSYAAIKSIISTRHRRK